MKRSYALWARTIVAVIVVSLANQSLGGISEVWVGENCTSEIAVMNPAAPGPATSPFNLGFINAIPAMAQAGQEVWVSSNFTGLVRRYTLDRQYVNEIMVSTTTPVNAMTQVGSEVWLTKVSGSANVLRYELDGGYVGTRTLTMPNRIAAMTTVGDKVWVADTQYVLLRPFTNNGGVGGADVYPSFTSGAPVASLTTVISREWSDRWTPPVETYEMWAGNAWDDEILRLDETGAEVDRFNCGRINAESLAFVNDYVFTPPEDNADFNEDGIVNLKDFVILKNNFSTGTIHAEGDANFNGSVTLTDFVVLKQQFGTSPPLPPLPTLPEPTTAALLTAAAGWLIRRRRR